MAQNPKSPRLTELTLTYFLAVVFCNNDIIICQVHGTYSYQVLLTYMIININTIVLQLNVNQICHVW